MRGVTAGLVVGVGRVTAAHSERETLAKHSQTRPLTGTAKPTLSSHECLMDQQPEPSVVTDHMQKCHSENPPCFLCTHTHTHTHRQKHIHQAGVSVASPGSYLHLCRPEYRFLGLKTHLCLEVGASCLAVDNVGAVNTAEPAANFSTNPLLLCSLSRRQCLLAQKCHFTPIVYQGQIISHLSKY